MRVWGGKWEEESGLLGEEAEEQGQAMGRFCPASVRTRFLALHQTGQPASPGSQVLSTTQSPFSPPRNNRYLAVLAGHTEAAHLSQDATGLQPRVAAAAILPKSLAGEQRFSVGLISARQFQVRMPGWGGEWFRFRERSAMARGCSVPG